MINLSKCAHQCLAFSKSMDYLKTHHLPDVSFPEETFYKKNKTHEWKSETRIPFNLPSIFLTGSFIDTVSNIDLL